MYEINLENHIKNIIKEGAQSYDEIFRRSKGAFPDIVFPIVKSAVDLPKSAEENNNDRALDALPEPNPSNFDWRFDQETIRFICDLLAKYNISRIGLFGAPSLFPPLAKRYGEVVLFDVNNLLVQAFHSDERINIIDINYLDTTKYGKFDCVFMDPPWYLSYFQNWFQKANELLVDGGMLISTLFQEFLRPDARPELLQIHDNASMGGDVSILNNAVSYVTPVFEKRIFAAKEIPVKGNWRVADLMVVKKQRQTELPIITVPKDDWIRILLNNKVIAIRQEAETSPVSVTEPFQTGTLLLTVSDRDPVKKKINLITSDNHGLMVTGTTRITHFLRALADGENRLKLTERMNINPGEQIFLNTILKLVNL